jgi:hypothetical protein
VIADFLAGDGGDFIGIEQALINFAGTAASAAGTGLSTDDYQERETIASIDAADDRHVIEITTAQTLDQLLNEIGGQAEEALVLVFNSTTSRGELWHDVDWSTAADRVQVATFNNIDTLAGIAAFNHSNFVEFS